MWKTKQPSRVFLELELRHEGYETATAADGRTGLAFALAEHFDLILLDVMLPDLSGFELLRRLRKERDTPVILLTALDTVMDKVNGLDIGANDYLTKPFHIEELLARIRAVLRQTMPDNHRTQQYTAGDLILDTARRQVTRGGQVLSLTKLQYDLLQFLLESQGTVRTREQILNHVWGYDYMGESNIVDVYVRYVRDRIHETEDHKLIETVRGVGYVIRENT
ncbi:MAG: response regulator transcription factor [Clostridia bacterium]